MVESRNEAHDTWPRARALARSRGERLGSIHLLAVLASEPGPAQRLLETQGIDGTWVRMRASLSAEPPSVLEQAEASAGRLARSLRARTIGPIHLLAALLRIPECAAHSVLKVSGIDIDRLSGAVHGYLSGAPMWRSRAREPGVGPPAAGRASLNLDGHSRRALPVAHAPSGVRHPVCGIRYPLCAISRHGAKHAHPSRDRRWRP